MNRVLRDFRLLPGRLDAGAQAALLADVLAAETTSPFRHLETPGGRTMSVAMFNMGPLGWVSDRTGYRYDPIDPLTGKAWPPIPQVLLDLWRELADPDVPPDACLVNRYRESARLSLHQDADEADFSYPVLSVSLGDTAVFRLGGRQGADRHGRCGWRLATWCCWPARRGGRSMGWTGSCRALQPSSPAAGGSI